MKHRIENLDLTIEKLIYGGAGLARLPADDHGRGKAAFVPFTLPGETVRAVLEEEKPGFVRARAEEILKRSKERVEPPCPYFRRCGGCHYQHTSYQYQLEIKANILRENLRRLAKMETPLEVITHGSPPWNYRNRTRLQVRVDAAFGLGYFQSSSHVLLPVDTCPINSPLLNRAIEAIWQLGRAGQVPDEVREIELFANDDDTQLQVEIYRDTRKNAKRTPASQTFAERLRSEVPEIVNASVFAQTTAAARGIEGHVSEAPECTLGPGEFHYRTKAGPLRVSGGSFFQVNRFLVEELESLVTAGRSGEIALDLYAGVGLFSVALAASFRHIVAVESSQGSASDLQYNAVRNVKAVRSTVDAYLQGRGANVRPDFVVVDPPRAGLGERVARTLASLGASRLTYVSCDPATLARDLITLIAGGYRVERLHLVDLFPQTYHIESVVELIR